jgi:hypothetical protein
LVSNKIKNMKQLLPFFLFLLPCLAWAQYPSNGNQKITLGEQTTADGLIYRGVLGDTLLITPSSDTSAYIILDTVNHRFYNYNRATNVWSMAGVGSISSGLTGVLPVANGGTGASSFSPNNYLIRTNSSGIFDTANIYEANGNVGINVIPSSWGSAFKAIESGDNNNQSAVAFNTNANGLNFFANAFFDGSNSKYKYNGFASRFVTADGKYEYYSAPSGTAGDNITFTEVMTILANGNVGIGTSTPTEKLHVAGTIKQTGGDGFVLVNGAYTSNIFSSPSTGDMFIDYPAGEELRIRNSGATTNMVLSNNGDVKINNLANASNPVNVQVDVNGVLIRSSSIELKDNVQNLPYGLNDLLLLKPYKFNYKDKYKFGEGYDIGFIAEDVNEIVPEAVGTGVNSDIFMDSVKLIPVLVKAIQEQNLLIKALEQRIINLENK